MNNQQTVSRSQPCSIAPKCFAQLQISDDLFGDEFDWDESENQYEGETLASDVLGFLRGAAE